MASGHIEVFLTVTSIMTVFLPVNEYQQVTVTMAVLGHYSTLGGVVVTRACPNPMAVLGHYSTLGGVVVARACLVTAVLDIYYIALRRVEISNACHHILATVGFHCIVLVLWVKMSINSLMNKSPVMLIYCHIAGWSCMSVLAICCQTHEAARLHWSESESIDLQLHAVPVFGKQTEARIPETNCIHLNKPLVMLIMHSIETIIGIDNKCHIDRRSYMIQAVSYYFLSGILSAQCVYLKYNRLLVAFIPTLCVKCLKQSAGCYFLIGILTTQCAHILYSFLLLELIKVNTRDLLLTLVIKTHLPYTTVRSLVIAYCIPRIRVPKKMCKRNESILYQWSSTPLKLCLCRIYSYIVWDLESGVTTACIPLAIIIGNPMAFNMQRTSVNTLTGALTVAVFPCVSIQDVTGTSKSSWIVQRSTSDEPLYDPLTKELNTLCFNEKFTVIFVQRQFTITYWCVKTQYRYTKTLFFFSFFFFLPILNRCFPRISIS